MINSSCSGREHKGRMDIHQFIFPQQLWHNEKSCVSWIVIRVMRHLPGKPVLGSWGLQVSSCPRRTFQVETTALVPDLISASLWKAGNGCERGLICWLQLQAAHHMQKVYPKAKYITTNINWWIFSDIWKLCKIFLQYIGFPNLHSFRSKNVTYKGTSPLTKGRTFSDSCW